MKSKTRVLLALLALVALFLGATGLVSAQTITSAFTDYTNSYGTTMVDLTAQGTIDWLQCGVNLSGANALQQHKATGGNAITVAITPTTPNTTTGWFPTWWSDGAVVQPIASNPTYNSPTMNGQTNKWQSCSQIVYTAPVDPAGGTRVLKIWTRNNTGTGSTMTAQLSSGAPVTLFTNAPTPFSNGGSAANFYGLVRVFYSSPNPGDILTVTYVGVGGAGLQAAGVALSNLTAPVFSPSPVNLRSASVGAAYTASLASFVTSSAGGALTYTPTGAPAWMTVAPATGAITGTPAAAGPVTFTVQVTDAVSGLSSTATVNLNVLANAAPVTKVAIVRDANNWPLDAYKAFLENTVYPGRTMVYYDTNARYTGSAFTAATRAELLDSDLIVFSNDVNNGNYTGNSEWDTLQVPILSLSMGLSGSMGWVGGNGGNTYGLRVGPQDYLDDPGNRGWEMMYNNNTPTNGGVPFFYNSPTNGTDPFFTGIPSTINAYVSPGGTNPSEGPQYGVSGCNLGTTKNGDQLVAGQWYQTGVWLQIFKSSMVISASNGVGANGGRTLLCAEDSADVLNNNWYNRSGYLTTVARWNQGDAMVGKNGFPQGARRFMFSIATGSVPDKLTMAFADPVNGMTNTGLLLLKNAHLQMYNPVNPAQPANPLNRRAAVNPGAPITVLKLAAQTFKDVPLSDVTVTDGGDGVAPAITWTVSPATGFDAVNSTGLTTANPTLRFTAAGVYTATVKASKANLDYVSGTKTITVQAPSVPYVVQTVPRKGRMVANLNSPANVTVAFDHLITFTAPLQLTVTVNGVPTVVNGTTADNINFSFNCSAIALSGTNTPIYFSLNTSTVKDGYEGILAYNGATYQWFAIYNAAGPKSIVVCSNRSAADNTTYQSILKGIYGPDAPITTLTSGYNVGPWTGAAATALPAAALVILDTNESGVLNTAQWASLAVPILCKDSQFLVQPLIGMAPARQNSTSVNKGFMAQNLMDNPYFQNVYVRGDDVVPVYNADNGASYPRYDTPSVYSLPAAAMPLGIFSNDYPQFYPVIYWPKNTPFYSGTTISAPARRMFFDGYNNDTNALVNAGLTANGIQMWQNIMSYFGQPTGAPLVVWSDPAATVGHAMTSVSVRFDRSTTSPGNLTITGSVSGAIGTYSAPVGSQDNVVWTYTIPTADMLHKGVQTLTLSVDMSTVTETESGMAVPYIGSPYTWTATYDPSKLRVLIGILDPDRTQSLMDNYVSLIKGVYGQSTWVRWLPSSGAGGFANTPWQAPMLANVNAVDMLIAGPNLNHELQNDHWPPANGGGYAYPKPVMFGFTANLNSGGNWGTNIPGNDNATISQLTVKAPTSPLFKGVTVTNGVTTVYNTPVNTVYSVYGIAANATKPLLATAPADGNRCEAYYVPANTLWYANSTPVQAGARMIFGPAHIFGASFFTPDGVTLFGNALKMLKPLAVAPTIVSTLLSSVPAGTLTVTFDQPVTSPGALTMKDSTNTVTIATVPSPTTTDGGTTWVYTLPVGTMTGKVAQTFNFSMVTTGLWETSSGLQLPFTGANPYTWTLAYDPGQQGISVVVFSESNDSTIQANYLALLKSIWGPNTTMTWRYQNYSDANLPVVQPIVQAANLLILDATSVASWKYDNTHGDFRTWMTTLTVPVVSFDGSIFSNLMCADTGGNQEANTTQFTVVSAASPIFNGVTTTGGVVNVFSPAATANTASYTSVRSGFLAGTAVGATRCSASYWPPYTQIVSGSITHAGVRASFALGTGANLPSLTADGTTMLKNLLKMARSLDAPPNIVSVTPTNGSLFTQSLPQSVSVTFDRPVAGLTNIMINGVAVGSPVGSVNNTVWTWNIPAAASPNVPGLITVTLAPTGIYETQSAGLQLPLAAGTTWSYTYDKSQFKPTIAFVSNTSALDDHSAYTSFLINDVYATSLYTHPIQIEDIRGKYYGLTAATAASMQATLSLVIVLPYQTESSLSTRTNWNPLTVPIIMHKPETCIDWGMANYTDSSLPGTLNGLPASWFLNSATAGTASIYDNLLTTDPWIKGIPTQTVFGPTTSRVIPWFQTQSQTFPSLGGAYWGQPIGTATLMGMFADRWNGSYYGVHWSAGQTYYNGTVAVAPRGYLAMGQNDATSNYGQNAVANFFDPINGAVDLGAKQMLRNALRWAMNPDSNAPVPLKVINTSPALVGGTSGVYEMPITVTFSKAVNGVLPSDLKWNASTSAVTYFATTATPTSSLPSATWIFDGAWETNNSLLGVFQPINITLNPMDSASHSHIVSADGDGCPAIAWTWNYVWIPVPASVSNKVWSLYE